MQKAAVWAVVLHALAIGAWLVLRTAWFDGSVGCDEEEGPAYDRCESRSDALTYFAVIEAALLALTILAFAVAGIARAAGRRRAL